jgi:cytochrome c
MKVTNPVARSPAHLSARPFAHLLAGAALLALSSLCVAADPSPAGNSGQGAFNNHCRTCHSTKAGDNRLGPALGKIVGAKAGSGSGYANYSQAMKSAGIVWDEATLDRFLTNPEEVVPNNNMKPFKGIPDPAVRKSIIDYLKSNSAAT